MSEEYYQSMKKLNYHSDMVLRTPTLTSGERILMMANRDPMNSFNYILSVANPKGKKDTNNCLDELRQKSQQEHFDYSRGGRFKWSFWSTTIISFD